MPTGKLVDSMSFSRRMEGASHGGPGGVPMALLCLLMCGAAAGQPLELAPLAPEFEGWQQQTSWDAAQLMASGEVSGYIPSPLDNSHLQEDVAVQPLSVQATALPSSYNLVALGYVTPVRDQGDCGSCWAFPAYGSLESWLLKNAGEERDLSENHLKNYHGFDWGPCEGGNDDISTAYLTRWSGPVDEMNDPYHDWDDRPSPGGPCEKYVEQVLLYTTADTIKEALMEHGALSVSLFWEAKYYNTSTFTYYCNKTGNLNHSVTLVGWDDAKGVTGAPGAGAWLVKNSWGMSWGNSGYFWISYYDKNAAKQAYAFSNASDPAMYQASYQYDPLGCTSAVGYGTTSAWGANVFTATADHMLSSVGFYARAHGASYEIYVYDNFSCGTFFGVLGSTSGTLSQAGYHTVALPSPIRLRKDDAFAIVVKFTTPGYMYPVPIEQPLGGYSSGASAQSGQSYVSSNGVSWWDLTSVVANTNACIKGLAVAPQFSGTPDEYTYELEADGDVRVTDTAPDRDGVVTLSSGTVEVYFLEGAPGGGTMETPVCLGVLYNLVIGTNGDDVLEGFGTIEDDAAGLNNRDLILGFSGNDSLRGINGNDYLFGGEGADRLYGDNGNDHLFGEGGNDILYPGSGDDESYGGAGTDLVVLAQPANTSQVYDGGPDSGDKLLLADGYGAFTMTGCAGFERFAGGDGNDSVDWSDATAALEMRGNGGNDTLTGGSGNDILRGFTGNDTLTGGDGQDYVYGEDGDDTLGGGAGTDTLYTGAGNDNADGGDGDNDRVVLEDAGGGDTAAGGAGTGDRLVLGNGYGAFSMTGMSGFEEFVGGDGDDTVDWSGATGFVTLRGNGGNDVLSGGAGNDLLTGGAGNDVLNGNGGADILYGEGGINHLTGGAGNDGIRGGGSDIAHFSDTPEAPRYSVRDRVTYVVVVDLTGGDGTDTIRGCPIGTLDGPYVP